MSQIPGTNVSAIVVPNDTSDTFPTHDETYGRGGYRSVATTAARDAIPTARRKDGMRVRVANVGGVSAEYLLSKDDTNSADAGTWSLNNLSGHITLPTFASIAAQNVSTNVFMITTLGYYAIGDGGGARYLVVGSAGTPPYGANTALYTTTSLDGRIWQIAEINPYVDQFGAKGISQNPVPTSTSQFDSGPAIQACIAWNEARGGGEIQSSGSLMYFSSQKITFDPVLTSHNGQGAAWAFWLKNFVTFDSQAELLTNGNFASGAAGWLVSAYNTSNLVFSTGAVTVDQAATVDVAKYTSFGQKIVAPQFSQVRITATVAYIHTVQDPVTPNHGVSLIFGRSSNSTGPVAIGDMPVITQKFISNSASDYAEPQTVTFDLILNVANQANPYIRIDSEAAFQITSMSVKVVPDNTCIFVRSTSTQTGHTKRTWQQLRLYGTADTTKTDLVDVMQFDSVTPDSSRLHMIAIDIGTGSGRALVFGNGTYLVHAFACRFSGTLTGVDTLPSAVDSGENITFTGCTFGSGKGPCVTNRGMSFRFFSPSMDYSGAFYRQYAGSAKIYASWEEKAKTLDPTLYYMEINKGSAWIFCPDLFTNSVPTGILAAPFKIDTGAVLYLNDANLANLDSTSDTLYVGGGDLIIRRSTGGASTPHLSTRNAYQNVIPDGSFEGAQIAPNIYLDCTDTSGGSAGASELVDRFHSNWKATTTYTADLTIGSNVILNTSTTTGTIAQGDIVSADGYFPPSTVVLGINNTASATTVVVAGTSYTIPAHSQMLSNAAMKTQTGVTLRWTRPTIIGSAGLELSTAAARSGAQSLRFYKTGGIGVGNPAQINLLIPILDMCGIGFETYFRVTPQPGATAGSTMQFYGSLYVVAGRDLASTSKLPVITKDFYFGYNQTQTIDRVSGHTIVGGVTQTDDWNRIFFSSMRNDPSQSGHPSFAPAWATHYQLRLSMFNSTGGTPGFECFFDDFLATYF